MNVYVVGGAVRNVLMGRPVNDMDYVVVGATIEDMLKAGFSQVGADFPVFLHPKTGDEYALARTERKNGKGYHGFTVDASPAVTLEEDLSRRDLTINAMAVRLEDWPALVKMCKGQTMPDHTEEWGHGSLLGVIDPFNGKVDLQYKLIRPVRLDTFVEDPLRVVRAARFAATYNMVWTQEMYQAAVHVVGSGELSELSAERYAIEVEKVLRADITAGDVARFVMHMDLLGLMTGGGAYAKKASDRRTSIGAKVAMMFKGYGPGSWKVIADNFCLSNTLMHQAETMFDAELLEFQISIFRDSYDAAVLAQGLYSLTERLKKAPAGAGLKMLEEWASDHHASAISKHLCQRVQQMNELFDTIRYQTHIGPDVPPSQINSLLKQARITKMIELLLEETKNPA